MKLPKKAEKPPVVANPYQAVEVKAGTSCCLAAKDIKGKRFLSRANPPKLPLPECNQMDQCDCRFAHHADRRVGQRRRWAIVDTQIGRDILAQHRAPGKIRRNRGRRKDD